MQPPVDHGGTIQQQAALARTSMSPTSSGKNERLKRETKAWGEEAVAKYSLLRAWSVGQHQHVEDFPGSTAS